MKKVLKMMMLLVLIVVLSMVGMILILTITDYNPESIEPLKVHSEIDNPAIGNEKFKVYTWNIGYGALGDQEDFFLDGGEKVRAESKEVVERYLNNIQTTLKSFNADFTMIQEIDTNSKRAYKIDELEMITKTYEQYSYSFAKNYDVLFVPIPWPPVGEVEAGLATFSLYDISDANRHKFESNYAWPKNTVMLDRCFMVSKIELADKDGDLILINAHFSAYDDGTLRAAQLKAVKDFITEAYDAGNYVVLGGDWNQTFENVDTSNYPLFENGDWFIPSVIPNTWLDEGWTYGVADNAATYRLLNAPYEKGVTQVGVVDGFVVSPNVVIEQTEVVDLNFKDSDHNPVMMEFILN